MHFNSKKDSNTHEEKDAYRLLNDPSSLNIYKNRYVPIDVLTIDKHSRLTITKKVKRLIQFYPDHHVIVFQDIYNKSFLLQIKQIDRPEMGSIVENLILIRRKINSLDNLYSSNGKNKRGDQYHLLNKVSQNDFDESSTDTLSSGSKKIIKLGYNDDTLYSVPILVIDDDQDLISGYDSALRRAGYKNVKAFSDQPRL